MANEAFALSPISARSASPNDADYDAIRDAFMETARGRWFLGEYAKRNRNADTAMVLEAVARLEQSVAASRAEAKATPSAVPEPAAPPAPARDEILTSVKAILERTRAAMAAALAEPDPEQVLAPFQRSARIIREIAWGLRESGADGRICNILDTQVRAITDACEAFARAEHRDAVLHTFDASLVQIEKLAQGEIVTSADEPVVDGPAANVSMARENIVQEISDGGDHTAAMPAQAPQDAPAQTVQTTIAEDPASDEEDGATSSLGASLIARGIVEPSNNAPPNPLAPIQRMSHAERMAFFS
ncbi:MAG: hypothetical protein K2X60_12860 [Xanthobacteraceae bacterium]|nr:hypothetical protein [Xanthobacteraceae bacterium]